MGFCAVLTEQDLLRKDGNGPLFTSESRRDGYDNVYINYFVSGNNESQEFVKCGAKQGENGVAFGPELGMAQKLHELYPDQIRMGWHKFV